MNKTPRKIFINVLLISAILIIIMCIIKEKYEENNIGEGSYETQKLTTEDEQNVENLAVTENLEATENINETYATGENIETEKIYPKEEIQTTYKGYDVCAKLEIPEISLETCVLTNYSTNALKVSVTKFWGANPNQVGNFCIAGHNYKNKNMFSKLKSLSEGDNLFIIDNHVGRVEYEIYKIYKVEPKDVSCLESETENKKEVTLITCTNDSKKRIIVKAKEIE